MPSIPRTSLLQALGLLALCLCSASAGGEETLRVARGKQEVVITRGLRPVVRYVLEDGQTLRPYFTALHAPGGPEVTRRHPPRAGIDPADHPTMHPGAWLAFGDLGGADFWRNQGRVEHAGFTTEPAAKDNVVRFAVRNHYRDGERLVCQEDAVYSLRVCGGGYLLHWDSTFSGTAPFAFGDQEEMGLGIRLATPLCVTGGSGTIATSEGKRNERQAWGTQAKWCDYSGVIDAQRVAIMLSALAENFRPSWLHVRDYGLAVANPFAQQALGRGAKSRLEIKPGQTLQLRFGLWWYSLAVDEKPDPDGISDAYHRLPR